MRVVETNQGTLETLERMKVKSAFAPAISSIWRLGPIMVRDRQITPTCFPTSLNASSTRSSCSSV